MTQTAALDQPEAAVQSQSHRFFLREGEKLTNAIINSNIFPLRLDVQLLRLEDLCGACLLEFDDEDAQIEERFLEANVAAAASVAAAAAETVVAEKSSTEQLRQTISDIRERTRSCRAVAAAAQQQAGSEAEKWIGLLDKCIHTFHYQCISRWADTENSCPQCKERFSIAAGYSRSGERQTLVRVKRKNQSATFYAAADESVQEGDLCQVCRSIGDASSLMSCNGHAGNCASICHFYCLGLSELPSGGDWFCSECVARNRCVTEEGLRLINTRSPEFRFEQQLRCPNADSRTLASLSVIIPTQDCDDFDEEGRGQRRGRGRRRRRARGGAPSVSLSRIVLAQPVGGISDEENSLDNVQRTSAAFAERCGEQEGSQDGASDEREQDDRVCLGGTEGVYEEFCEEGDDDGVDGDEEDEEETAEEEQAGLGDSAIERESRGRRRGTSASVRRGTRGRGRRRRRNDPLATGVTTTSSRVNLGRASTRAFRIIEPLRLQVTASGPLTVFGADIFERGLREESPPPMRGVPSNFAEMEAYEREHLGRTRYGMSLQASRVSEGGFEKGSDFVADLLGMSGDGRGDAEVTRSKRYRNLLESGNGDDDNSERSRKRILTEGFSEVSVTTDASSPPRTLPVSVSMRRRMSISQSSSVASPTTAPNSTTTPGAGQSGRKKLLRPSSLIKANPLNEEDRVLLENAKSFRPTPKPSKSSEPIAMASSNGGSFPRLTTGSASSSSDISSEPQGLSTHIATGTPTGCSSESEKGQQSLEAQTRPALPARSPASASASTTAGRLASASAPAAPSDESFLSRVFERITSAVSQVNQKSELASASTGETDSGKRSSPAQRAFHRQLLSQSLSFQNSSCCHEARAPRQQDTVASQLQSTLRPFGSKEQKSPDSESASRSSRPASHSAPVKPSRFLIKLVHHKLFRYNMHALLTPEDHGSVEEAQKRLCRKVSHDIVIMHRAALRSLPSADHDSYWVSNRHTVSEQISRRLKGIHEKTRRERDSGSCRQDSIAFGTDESRSPDAGHVHMTRDGPRKRHDDELEEGEVLEECNALQRVF